MGFEQCTLKCTIRGGVVTGWALAARIYWDGGWNPSWGWTPSSNQSGFPMSSKRLSKTDSGRRLHHPSRLPEMLWNLIFAFHGSMASTFALVSLIENVGGQLLHRIVCTADYPAKLNHPICHTFTMILVPHIQAAYNQEFETGSIFNSFLLPQWNAPMHPNPDDDGQNN